MLDDESSSVRQGFLCPFCFDDLGDVNALQAHVDVRHPEGSAVEDSIDQIKKGIISQARKIKWTASSLLESIPSTSSYGASESRPSLSSSQSIGGSGATDKKPERKQQLAAKPVGKLGMRRSLMESFRECRDALVHETAVRTNMLIIRLDRLLNECPSDPSGRKDFERMIVPWIDDSSVSVCIACAAKFSITRRRHHCRLCGAIMCASCSRLLPYLSARKLTNPALAAQMIAAKAALESDEATPLASLDPAPMLGRQSSTASAMAEIAKKRSGQLLNLLRSAKETMTPEDNDDGSVRSLQSQDAAEQLRVCPSCMGFLSRRETQMESGVSPSFVSLYEQLRVLLTEVTNLSPSFARTALSLRNGETLYTLPDAEKLRLKLVMKQKEIDMLSKHIADDDSESSAVEANLRKRIRGAALMELQQTVVALPPLPSEEEYATLKEKRKAEVSRQIADSRSRMEEAQKDARNKPLSSSPSMPSIAGAKREEKRGGSKNVARSNSNSVLDGWTPEQRVATNPFMDEEEQDHPLIVQRMQVKGFLQQAADAGKVDDAKILEENLRMIDEEIMRLGIDSPR